MDTAQLIRCPKCGANNRVSGDRLARGEAAVCGRCKETLPSPTPARRTPIVVADATFANLVERSSVPVLVDLWAPWCGPCRMLTPTLEQLAGEWGARVTVAKLNVDQNPATAARFDARSIPLLVLIQHGQEVDRMVGVQPAAAIRQRVERFLG